MRHAEVSMIYQGVDITEDIKGDIDGFTYEEYAEGKTADSLTINLQNRDLRWMGAWKPQAGDQIQASLTSYDWNAQGEILALNCGTLEVDDPTFGGPPDLCHLKALSIPAAAGFSDAPQDTTWAVITMSALGEQIADKYGLQFDYQAPQDFTIHALKRTKQSDADLLATTAAKYNLCLKIYANKLVIFSKYVLEQAPPVATITYGTSNIESYNLSSPVVGTGYNAAIIKYKPTKSKVLCQYEFRIAPGGKSIIEQQAVDDDQQAEMMAQGLLRKANEKQFAGTITLSLYLVIVAGCTVQLVGWGQFDGKYFVDGATHDYGDKEGTTEITIHKCLAQGPQGGY